MGNNIFETEAENSGVKARSWAGLIEALNGSRCYKTLSLFNTFLENYRRVRMVERPSQENIQVYYGGKSMVLRVASFYMESETKERFRRKSDSAYDYAMHIEQ